MSTFRLSVSVGGVKDLSSKLDRLDAITKGAVREVVQSSAIKIQNEARANCPKDTANTAKTIRWRPLDDGLTAEIGTDVLTAVFLEFGTRPHPTAQSQASRKIPPPGVLLSWMRRHGIRPSGEMVEDAGGDKKKATEQLEFLIRRKIQVKGTPARPFLFPAYESERPRFLSRLEKRVGDQLRSASSSNRKQTRTPRSQ